MSDCHIPVHPRDPSKTVKESELEHKTLNELTVDELDYVALGIMRASDCRLQFDGSRFWLSHCDCGSAILVPGSKTVGHVWRAAKTIDAAVTE